MVAALHRVIVLVGGRRNGQGGRGRGRRGRGVARAGRVAFGGGIVLGVGVVDQGDVGLRVLYPELGVGHEVVDGRPRLGLLQPLIEGDGAAECIHHSDLEGGERGGAGGRKKILLATLGRHNHVHFLFFVFVFESIRTTPQIKTVKFGQCSVSLWVKKKKKSCR